MAPPISKPPFSCPIIDGGHLSMRVPPLLLPVPFWINIIPASWYLPRYSPWVGHGPRTWTWHSPVGLQRGAQLSCTAPSSFPRGSGLDLWLQGQSAWQASFWSPGQEWWFQFFGIFQEEIPLIGHSPPVISCPWGVGWPSAKKSTPVWGTYTGPYMWPRGACAPPPSFEISHPISTRTYNLANPPVTPHTQFTPSGIGYPSLSPAPPCGRSTGPRRHGVLRQPIYSWSALGITPMGVGIKTTLSFTNNQNH